MTWTSIFIAGLITYFTRMGMITLIDKDIFNENFRKILNYVPSVVFPSIIFPGVLLDDYGTLVVITDPKNIPIIVEICQQSQRVIPEPNKW